MRSNEDPTQPKKKKKPKTKKPSAYYVLSPLIGAGDGDGNADEHVLLGLREVTVS